MLQQSTRHILMIEPVEFYANPETMDTNVYQVEEENVSPDELLRRAVKEFRDYRDKLVEHGVIITTVRGHKGCPDMVFPNWMSTHAEGKLFIYPMYNENRRMERSDEIIEDFKGCYHEVIDWTAYEKQNFFLEATASLCLDRVHKVAYAGLSRRTSRELAEKWAQEMGYELFLFETQSHRVKPVYHTDFMMFIGTKLAGVCTPCIMGKDRQEEMLKRLRRHHDVVEFTMEQLALFCGNALEVIGHNGIKMLTMSSAAYKALTDRQLDMIHSHYKFVIHSPLDTLEKYGGGSARCMLMEIFTPQEHP